MSQPLTPEAAAARCGELQAMLIRLVHEGRYARLDMCDPLWLLLADAEALLLTQGVVIDNTTPNRPSARAAHAHVLVEMQKELDDVLTTGRDTVSPPAAVAYRNATGRIQCGQHEFTSGSCVDVLIRGRWLPTRIEHNGREYYSVDKLPLIDNPVRWSKD